MGFLLGNGYFAGPPSESGALMIGGRTSLRGAVSPNTGLALTQFARISLGPGGFLVPGWTLPEMHFLYSWKCKIHEGDFSYRYVNGEIEIVEFCKGTDDYDDFPYENYPPFFEQVRLSLQRIEKEDQSIILKLNEVDCEPNFKFNDTRANQLSVPTHQFGGVPYLHFSSAHRKDCVICGHEIPVVASIGNNSYSNNEGFSGNDFVQVVYWACSSCNVLSASNFCD
ncbi:hypothetical protein [Collimonas humicola]|uniref:hypothetical protein n=1 Tax=Collimonas humicola TaxID=2825886 RepID=UPI001B8B100E|nr:hypothetical protein [Collimonas humicola]